jgi:hypothetical protein
LQQLRIIAEGSAMLTLSDPDLRLLSIKPRISLRADTEGESPRAGSNDSARLMNPQQCPHCHRALIGDHELSIGCCLLCRRYALLRGTWPEQTREKNMTINLTDAQITRLFDLCIKIVLIRQELPASPQGMDVDLESAQNLRRNLEAQNDVLVELGALLR